MLYHQKLGFPVDIKKISGVFLLTYTKHALNASKNDRYGNILLPTHLNTDCAILVEMEVMNNVMVKGVYRVKYNNKYDLVIVMTNEYKVKTVWLNTISDTHTTLDETKYIKVNI